MNFAQFMELALYHPEVGYYTRPRIRVGYGEKTDFFTSSSSGKIFGELMAAACLKLLAGADPRNFEFVELGAETEHGILAGVSHPFRSARTVRFGEPWRLSGSCIVFSNELFDAQPFRRFAYRRGGWRELGVEIRIQELFEVEIDSTPPANLPIEATEDYRIDAPFAAADLVDSISSDLWSGLFVACDYGKSWSEIAHNTPGGTARAYFNHTQSNRLLEQAGNKDLTCHICWDWLSDRLRRNRFSIPTLESQESFLVRNAGETIAAISTEEALRMSQRKLALMQLLHPSHLGQKFQVLHAFRAP
jgi:SAM-dependent MidA family methyltransferase